MRRSFVVGICALVVVAAGTLYFLSANRPSATQDALAPAATTSEDGAARHVPDGWREYQSGMYRFSLLYPPELEVSERFEVGGAATIIFQNPEEGKGFQIFIVPFTSAQITDERFKKDVPSGVRADLIDITVDGATGAAFYSTNAALGETREIWFIKDGYLYEVTTLRSLDAWLAGIMQTWKFL